MNSAIPPTRIPQDACALVAQIEQLPITDAIQKIVELYIKERLMPLNPLGDALHVALASYHKCDYLLTWNCRHIANPNKFHQLQTVNALMGQYVPLLVTPNQLIGA